ncbi:hypothetical protein FH972_021871 [Carpinus fangiana]|uniref:Importin N-terminal domain-containing protein n=1 Tax=Carpinus fangiana TaxID=176857 RepID=A0A5N6KSR0_9ROSI|nr:hypothetical protein FH972_021871 [Carpinus fangiana]
MDPGALRSCIQATLATDANIRRQSELDLRHAEENPGFVDALMNILEVEQENSVRQATVVYLKNRVTKAWNPPDDYPANKRITDQERTSVRARVVPLIASSPPNVRAQLIPILQAILHTDFPERWPDVFQLTVQLLHSDDAASVYAGLQCILCICRVYRFKSGNNRADFENGVVVNAFPQLLAMGNRLVQETSIEAGEMLRAIMKAFKHAIYFELPAHLREQQNTVGWCTLFLSVVAKDPPPCSMADDADERETNHWWKAKKWAYANLNRLFVRYGNPATLSKSNGDEYAAFSKSFLEQFAPEILKIYLQQIEKWVGKTLWLSKAALSQTLTYLDECVKPKIMWANLQPHSENLVSHLVFPVLCLSEEDLELFENEPSEYLHRKLNYYEQVSAPDVAAMNFLVSLTKHRKKETFTVLNFVNSIVNKYEAAADADKQPMEKEGALKMIGTLASVLLGKKSPIADQVEYFFVRHVFPEFSSPHGFLRARACDTLEKFEALEFKEESNLLLAYRSILQCMADEQLPVRVEAALALQPLIRHDVIRENMQSNIPQIMQQLLKLANEVDVDALANVMEDFVEVFAAELTPFAVALTEQLRDTYLRIIREVIEKEGQGDEDEDGLGVLDDKSVTALGVLQTIGTLILTLESTPDVLQHLETILMPLISTTLDHKLYDLYTEVFEIIDSCTFAAKSISPTMWQAFELMHKTFKNGAELYLEDMLPALENFIQFGPSHMATNPQYVEAVVDMTRDIFENKKVGKVDRICGCKLAEGLMLSLRGHVDEHIPEFIRLAMNALGEDDVKVKSYKIHLIEVVINAIYYNPQLTLSTLESSGLTNKLFSFWFANIDNFTRVHDKKLSIAAITALLNIPPTSVPQSVQQGWPRLLQGCAKLFKTLPEAEKNREEAKRENEFQLNSDFEDDEDEGDWGEEDGWQNEAGDAEDVRDESSAYLDFLSEEAQKYSAFGGDDDDELEEESILETPLDELEPYSMFKQSLLKLQSEQPQFYEGLLKQIEPAEQQVLEAVVNQADAVVAQKAEQARAAAAEAAAQSVNGA